MYSKIYYIVTLAVVIVASYGLCSSTDLDFGAFKKCVNDKYSQSDLEKIKTYLLNVKASKIPVGWCQRFCESTKYKKFEYATLTKSITGAPILLSQHDLNNDGDALLPHTLIIGGHKKPQFVIAPIQKSKFDQFHPWCGECVPFLFERESEKKWIQAINSGKLNQLIYYIATLCRQDKFAFKYYKYEHQKWFEIEPNEFPKNLALQNLWHYESAGIKYAMNTPKFIQDGIKKSDDIFTRERLKISPESYGFYTGLTARMWAHLESGVDFWEFDNRFSDEAAKEHAVIYREKYSIK
jgi:hypothetical protein